MKSLINILFIISPLALFAQQADSVKKVVDPEKKSYIPTGIRVGIDVIPLIRTATEAFYSGYEFNADVDFYRYYLAVEAGKWGKIVPTDAEYYENTGRYGRIGVDINFLTKDPDKNMFFFGARYARSTYSEDFTMETEDPVWGYQVTTYSNSNVHAKWGELTTGLRVKMWKFFWMGYTARYKFGLNTDHPTGLVSYDIPGYGKTTKGSTWGFNYQFLFRIPFRKEPKPKPATD